MKNTIEFNTAQEARNALNAIARYLLSKAALNATTMQHVTSLREPLTALAEKEVGQEPARRLFDGYKYTYNAAEPDNPDNALSCDRCGRSTIECAIYTGAEINNPSDFGQYCAACRDELRAAGKVA